MKSLSLLEFEKVNREYHYSRTSFRMSDKLLSKEEMIEMTKQKPNFFCWEKSNGRWMPMLFHGEVPEFILTSNAGPMRMRQTDPKGEIIRTKIQPVDPSLSLAECIALHPMRSE